MTVLTELCTVVYTGNSNTVDWPVSFPVNQKSDLTVTLITVATGVESTINSALYDWTPNSDRTGTVKYPNSGSGISSSYQVRIDRNVTFTQDEQISTQSGFNPAVIEGQLDKIVMQTTQLKRDLGLTSDTTDELQGIIDGLISGVVDALQLSTYSAVSALTALYTGQLVFVKSYHSNLGRGSGYFYYDATDTTSLDDGGTIAVDAAGRRWKRLYDGTINPQWFGAKGDGVTDDAAAFTSCIAHAKARIAAGSGDVVIDCGGRCYAFGSTVSFDNGTDNITVCNFKFIPLGTTANWIESAGTTRSYWRRNQTYGTTFQVQKPLIQIGSSNPGFCLVNGIMDCGRICAGIYAFGNSKNRVASLLQIDNVLTYGVYVTGTMQLSKIKLRINTDVSGTRDSYGVGYDAIDTHWDNVTIQWGHCCLLTTGATLMMVDCDLFNGNDSSPPANPRLWEHRGNTITWIGGRLGNGKIHCWSTDLAIQPSKIGLTSGATVDDYILFYSKTAGQKLDSFQLGLSELPQALRTGAVDWVGFKDPTTFTATTSNTNATITAVSSTANLQVGQVLANANIPVGATITEIDSVAMTITLSAACTGSAVGTTITPAGAWDTNTKTALDAKNGYFQFVSRGMSLIATEGNNNYALELINAPQTHSLVRFKSGGAPTVIPEFGLRSSCAYMGFSATVGWSIPVDGSLRPSTDGTGPGIFSGAGSPEGVVTAPSGSMYTQNNASKGNPWWFKASGTGNTGWVNMSGKVELLKGTTTDRTATITIAADPALQFAMLANTKYHIKLYVFFDTTAAADFKFDLSGPAGPTLVRSVRRWIDPTNLTTLLAQSEQSYSASTAIAGGAGTVGGYIEYVMTVHNGGNAGTFAFRWAQNTSDAGNTSVLAGSKLEVEIA